MSAPKPSRAGGIAIAIAFLGVVVLGVCALGRRHEVPPPVVEALPAPSIDPSALAQLPRVMLRPSDLAEPWPFTASEGALWCIGYHGVNVVVFEAGGVRYAVNGRSRGRVTMGRYNLHDAREIAADDPHTPGQKLSLSEVLQRGLALCPEPTAR